MAVAAILGTSSEMAGVLGLAVGSGIWARDRYFSKNILNPLYFLSGTCGTRGTNGTGGTLYAFIKNRYEVYLLPPVLLVACEVDFRRQRTYCFCCFTVSAYSLSNFFAVYKNPN